MIAALPPGIPPETVGFYALLSQFFGAISDPERAKRHADDLVNKMQACEAVRSDAQKLLDSVQAMQMDMDKRADDVRKQAVATSAAQEKVDADRRVVVKEREALNVREVALNNKQAQFAARENGIAEREKAAERREKALDEASAQLEKLRAEYQGKIDKLKSLAA